MKVKQQTNKHKAEPRAPLCPLAGFRECRRRQCALWDDDWTLCSLNYGSLYSSIRVAVCDAAVEVIGEYGGGKQGTGNREQGTGNREQGTGDDGERPLSSFAPQAPQMPPSPEGEGKEDGEAGA